MGLRGYEIAVFGDQIAHFCPASGEFGDGGHIFSWFSPGATIETVRTIAICTHLLKSG